MTTNKPKSTVTKKSPFQACLMLLAGSILPICTASAGLTVDSSSSGRYVSGVTLLQTYVPGQPNGNEPHTATISSSAVGIFNETQSAGASFSASNPGYLATGVQNTTVSTASGLQVTGNGSATTRLNAAMPTPQYSERRTAEGTSSVAVAFTITSTTYDFSMSGAVASSGMQGNTDPNASNAFSVGNVSWEMRRVDSATPYTTYEVLRGSSSSGGLGQNLSYSDSSTLAASGRLAPGDYVFSIRASAGGNGNTNVGQPMIGVASFSNLNFNLTAGPAVSSSVVAGVHQFAISDGGPTTPGGIEAHFDMVSAPGEILSNYQTLSLEDLSASRPELIGQGVDFELVGGEGGHAQIWDLGFNGAFTGEATLTFSYDPTLLASNFNESDLRIAHFVNGSWQLEDSTVDADANTLTITTNGFSPFVLTAVPEASTYALLALGGAAVLLVSRKRKHITSPSNFFNSHSTKTNNHKKNQTQKLWISRRIFAFLLFLSAAVGVLSSPTSAIGAVDPAWVPLLNGKEFVGRIGNLDPVPGDFSDPSNAGGFVRITFGEPDASVENVAFIQKGAAQIGDQKYKISGGVTNTGNCTIFFYKKDKDIDNSETVPLPAEAHLKFTASSAAYGSLSGNVTLASGKVMPLTLLPVANSGKAGDKSAFSGKKFNCALLSLADSTSQLGTGIMVASVGATGAAKIAGVLPDGTPIVGTTLAGREENGNLHLSLFIGKAKTSFALAFTISANPGANEPACSGAALWLHGVGSTFKPEGFSEKLEIIGTQWSKPSGAVVTGGTFSLHADPESVTVVKKTDFVGTWPSNNKTSLTAAPKGAKFTFQPTTGLFSGTLPTSEGKVKTLPFRGLMLAFPVEQPDTTTVQGFGYLFDKSASGNLLIETP